MGREDGEEGVKAVQNMFYVFYDVRCPIPRAPRSRPKPLCITPRTVSAWRFARREGASGERGTVGAAVERVGWARAGRWTCCVGVGGGGLGLGGWAGLGWAGLGWVGWHFLCDEID